MPVDHPSPPPLPADGEQVIEAPEVRTRRLVVTDEGGLERIVGEVAGTHAEFRIALADNAPGKQSMVVITAGADPDFGQVLAVELWAEGNQVVGLQAWKEGSGPWHTEADTFTA